MNWAIGILVLVVGIVFVANVKPVLDQLQRQDNVVIHPPDADVVKKTNDLGEINIERVWLRNEGDRVVIYRDGAKYEGN